MFHYSTNVLALWIIMLSCMADIHWTLIHHDGGSVHSQSVGMVHKRTITLYSIDVVTKYIYRYCIVVLFELKNLYFLLKPALTIKRYGRLLIKQYGPVS